MKSVERCFQLFFNDADQVVSDNVCFDARHIVRRAFYSRNFCDSNLVSYYARFAPPLNVRILDGLRRVIE